jgi:hypothetical protein
MFGYVGGNFMRVIMQPIEMIAISKADGVQIPRRFKYEGNAINVDKLEFAEEAKHSGNKVFVYKCHSVIDGSDRIYEVKFDTVLTKWFLYRI